MRLSKLNILTWYHKSKGKEKNQRLVFTYRKEEHFPVVIDAKLKDDDKANKNPEGRFQLQGMSLDPCLFFYLFFFEFSWN